MAPARKKLFHRRERCAARLACSERRGDLVGIAALNDFSLPRRESPDVGRNALKVSERVRACTADELEDTAVRPYDPG